MCEGLLSDRQSWQITIPFELTPEDLEFLIANPITDSNMWYLPIYQPIKNRIRDHYMTQQNCTCAYCRLPLNPGTDNVEIEHIVDKNRRLDYVFESLNLVVSCHNCNFAKKSKRVLHNCPVDYYNYPTNPDQFAIIHGHFDDYFANIEIRGSTYHAIEDKGTFTIDTCKLDRIALAEQREEVEMYQNDPLIAKVIAFRKAGNQEALLNNILQQLTNIQNS